MTKHDESKHPRDRRGQWANKPAGRVGGAAVAGFGNQDKPASIDDIAAEHASASRDTERLSYVVNSKLSPGSSGITASGFSYQVSTSDYLYSADIDRQGQVTERINGKLYEPDGEHVHLRSARSASKRVHGALPDIAAYTAADHRRLEAGEKAQDATFYRVTDEGGDTVERHFSERGAEIGAGRHPGWSVAAPRYSHAEYEAAWGRAHADLHDQKD